MISEDSDWRVRTRDVLKMSSNFGKLEDEVLAEFVSQLRYLAVPGGTVVLREGDSSDSVMILISGRLRVWREDAQGHYKKYNEINPGESVGEAGLILGFNRTANVTALRDSLLAVLSRTEFESLLTRRPVAINRVFSQSIYDYLRHKQHEGINSSCKTFAIVPLDSKCESSLVARSLVDALSKKGKVHLLSSIDGDDNALATQEIGAAIVQLDEIERNNKFLIYETEAANSPWTLKAVHQCDQIIFVVDADNPDTGLTALEQKLIALPGFNLKRKHLVLLHRRASTFATPTTPWLRAHDVERVYPVRADNSGDFARLVRFLTDSAVGVVLGGGGARGFAHIGVLKALEESGCPIDLLGGNSMGALIGAQYAMGVSTDEICERTRKFAQGGEFPTLPFVSILSGRRMERDLRKMFGDAHIDTLWRSFFATACNLSQADTTIQDSGEIWHAIMASNSPAGLLPPVVHNGDLLVDGAILDNVPVSAMRSRLGTPLEQRRGNGTVIAVDVDVRDNFKVPASLRRLSALDVLRSNLGVAPACSPGIVDILYRAGHIGSMQLRSKTIALADYYLEPPVAGFPLMGYRQAHAIVDAGYRYAVAQLERWHSH